MVEDNEVRITVEGNKAAVRHFITWLCGSGEQEYWNYMQKREDPENIVFDPRTDHGPITIIDFDYHSTGKFGSPIIGTLGRLDENE